MAQRHWLVRDRKVFLARLTESGDVRAAAAAAGKSVADAFCRRAADDEFAENWARALENAWELLEGAMLAGLLQAVSANEIAGPPAAAMMPTKDPAAATIKELAKPEPKPAMPTPRIRDLASFDWKPVLAALQHRPKVAATAPRGQNDGAAVARLRAEIAALPRAVPARTGQQTADSPPQTDSPAPQ